MSRVDVGRLGAAVGAPGIDPREWLSLAAVISDPAIEDGGGYYCRVRLMPSGGTARAAISVPYAGGGFGEFLPLLREDIVIVGCPGGLPDSGYYVLARFWQPSDPPPAEVTGAAQDLLRLAPPGRTMRLATQGTGHVQVEARGTGRIDLTANEVRVGAAPVEAMIKGQTYRSSEDAMLSVLQAAQTAIAALGTALATMTAPAGPFPHPPTTAAAGAAAAACTAAATAIATFQSAAASYLAIHGKVS